MAQLGHGALLLAFALALLGIAFSVIGQRKRIPELTIAGVRAVVAVTLLLGIAAIILAIAFVTHDYSFQFVSSRSSRDMPLRYIVTAFYGGQEGSLLWWATAASILGSLAFARNRARFPNIVPYAAAVFLGIQAFLLYMLCFVASPFSLNRITPADGVGLNPLLRDPGMLVHPPLLLTGLASFAVPFSIAAGALVTGKMSAEWLRFVRRWTMIAWAILGAGIFFGGWWAYHVLGWGGYWAWDPVENVSLLPWLTATAFIHSIMVQERRGMLKVWNISLLLASYVLAVFGTFVVRSGLISSVHSFALSDIGPYFLGFLAAVTALAVGLIAWRLPLLQSENTFDSMVSREAGFLLNNLLFAGIAFATFWGTVYPLISEAFNDTRMTVGAPFYNQVNGPLLLLLLILMGIGPLLAWRQTIVPILLRSLRAPLALALLAIIGVLAFFGQPMAAIGIAAAVFAIGAIVVEYWRGARLRRKNAGDAFPVAIYHLTRRDPRRYGGYIVHLGVAIIAIGIVASTFFQSERLVVLEQGQAVTVAGYTIRYDNLREQRSRDARIVTADLTVTRGGSSETFEAHRYFFNRFEDQPTTRVGVVTLRFTDVYVMLTEWSDTGAANLHIFINPLVTWIWAGGFVYLIGMFVIFWPAAQPRSVQVRVPDRQGALGETAG
ncbi:MAG: cytochrome C biogenesis protein [Chloroflexi bacterium]|nr:MAG: cytochrome C biogenesis protein [Chloroflexota bacterium]